MTTPRDTSLPTMEQLRSASTYVRPTQAERAAIRAARRGIDWAKVVAEPCTPIAAPTDSRDTDPEEH